MGLEAVELVVAFEENFGIAIPDEIAAGMITPRHVVEYVTTRIPTGSAAHCLTQHTFYRVRRGLRATLANGADVKPGTRLDTVATKHTWPGFWSALRGAAGTERWPETVPWRGWLRDGPADLRELVLHIVAHLPRPDPARGEAWTRERIEVVVRQLVYETVGKRGFSLDDEFVRDIGID